VVIIGNDRLHLTFESLDGCYGFVIQVRRPIHAPQITNSTARATRWRSERGSIEVLA
jgi:hypothetical protein